MIVAPPPSGRQIRKAAIFMRRAGILMPVFSLPSPCGIGTLGEEARKFAEFLVQAGQSCWQVLPMGPTSYGDSPYQSYSSFAGSPYYIDFDDLCSQGLLEKEEYQSLDWGDDPCRVDYALQNRQRFGVLRLAADRLAEQKGEELEQFCLQEKDWLEDYALFMALKEKFGGRTWTEWPEDVRLREPSALASARKELAGEVRFWSAVQFMFFRQWESLKTFVNGKGITVIGDLPIYVSRDSADVWASPDQFQLDEHGRPTEVAGCPPDAFTADGQLWGNPLFRWDRMKEDGYAWWLRRIAFQFRLYDTLRIDHFRGFESYYAIPAGEKTARIGEWRKGPGMDFFEAVNSALGRRDIIAEDLGFLTEEVHRLLAATGYPGMKVLQFGFSADMSDSAYLPHNWPRSCVAYAGTHDNDTILGWLNTITPRERNFARRYMHLTRTEGLNWGVMRTVWASPADLAVVQMQDLLNLGSEARINIPSTLGGNWQWRMEPGAAGEKLAKKVRSQMRVYQRLPKGRK